MKKNNLNHYSSNDEIKEVWSSTLEIALNKQIEVELTNYATYEEMANFFANENRGCPGLANFLRKEADEELKHARNFMDYQNQRGGNVEKIIAVAGDISSLERVENKILEAYRLALDFEKSTYLSLIELHELAPNDPSFQDFISESLCEQLEGQKTLNDTIRYLEKGGPVIEALHEKELRKELRK